VRANLLQHRVQELLLDRPSKLQRGVQIVCLRHAVNGTENRENAATFVLELGSEVNSSSDDQEQRVVLAQVSSVEDPSHCTA
jgi:hypothetical protein